MTRQAFSGYKQSSQNSAKSTVKYRTVQQGRGRSGNQVEIILVKINDIKSSMGFDFNEPTEECVYRSVCVYTYLCTAEGGESTKISH